MLITEKKIRKIIKKTIRKIVLESTEKEYKAYYYPEDREASNLPDDPEDWPKDAKDLTIFNLDEFKTGATFAAKAPELPIKIISIDQFDSNKIKIIFDTSFFIKATIILSIPLFQADIYHEFPGVDYISGNAANWLAYQTFSDAFEMIQKYSNQYRHSLMSDRVQNILEAYSQKSSGISQDYFDEAVWEMKTNLVIDLSSRINQRPAYYSREDLIAGKAFNNISTFFHEADHRHKYKFKKFNDYIKQLSGEYKLPFKKLPWPYDELAKFLPDVTVASLTGGAYGKSHEKAQFEYYKDSVKRMFTDEDYMAADLKVSLPPLDFNLEYLSSHNKNSWSDEHGHGSLYNLKSDHIDETIHRLVMYADNNQIDLTSKEDRKKFIYDVLDGNMQIPDEYDDLNNIPEALENTEKNINWFEKKITKYI